jgi:murein DD-endopeptidase MepM/ murein hydrolase activator NlpD
LRCCLLLPFEFGAYPVQGRPLEVTSGFNAPRPGYPITTNQKHEGIDLKAPYGWPIVCVADGVVEWVRIDPGYGYGTAVRVRHSDRYLTWYGHFKNYVVQVGQVVTAGQLLGYADSTGDVYPPPTPTNPGAGSHLHLTLVDEVAGLDGYIVSKVVDPLPWLGKFG